MLESLLLFFFFFFRCDRNTQICQNQSPILNSENLTITLGGGGGGGGNGKWESNGTSKEISQHYTF